MTVSRFSQLDDQRAVRKQSLRSVLTKTDRIVSGQDLTVDFDSFAPAPAYTNGDEIWIDDQAEPVTSALNDGIDASSLQVITALNYHELAHCMFMPRMSTQFVKDIIHRNALFAYNILQDQADETKFVTLFDPAKDYFIRLVTTYMMESPEYLEMNYPLVSGRLFLPASLREKFKERFINPEKIDRIDELIAEYKTLVYPDDQSVMFAVVLAFDELLRSMDEKPHISGMLSHDRLLSGEPDKELTKRLANEEKERQEEDAETQEEADEQQEDSEGETAGAQGEEADEEPEEEGEGAQGSQEESSQAGAGASDRDDSVSVDTDKTLEEELEEVERESYENKREELQDNVETIREEEGNYKVDVPMGSFHTSPPDPALLQTIDRCKEEFDTLAEQHSPGWHMNQRYGKLNHRQYGRALGGAEHVYRRWYEGVHDALDFEVVFLLDVSSSMGMENRIDHSSESLWVLRRVFDDLDGVTTTMSFGNEVSLLSQRGEQAGPRVPMYQSGGGTIVTEALLEARRILGVSRKPLRFCVVITDGHFMDKQTAIDELNRFGEMVVVIGINQEVSVYESCRDVVLTTEIKEATGLVETVKSFALHIARERQLGRTYG